MTHGKTHSLRRSLPDRFLGIAVLAVAVCCCGPVQRLAADEAAGPTWRYLRPAGDKFVQETEIRLQRAADDLVVTSVTQRGSAKLTVSSRFAAGDLLRSARVTLRRGDEEQAVTVRVAGSTAHVVREGKDAVELPCPRGVIVTSAPDWTDAFLAVRRYDPRGDATQQFAGLWVHPTREPLELAIKLTRSGRDVVQRDGQRRPLDRLLLVLRGGSRYVVWRDDQGQLVRLLSEKSAAGGIVLAGWEQATRDLRPE